MEKLNFCADWQFAPRDKAFEPVTLPHDAQIREMRAPDASDSGHGFFPGGVYVYEKRFTPPEEWAEKAVYIEFEGVYRNCTVSLNGQKIGGHRYGYTNFLLPLALRCGEENVLTVTADNSELPNSRWYTGSGIYRPVWLHVGEKTHIAWQGVKITTLCVNPAVIRVETEATDGDVRVEILDGDSVLAKGEGADCRLELPGAKLWSEKTPALYTCRVSLFKNGQQVDATEEKFGVRQLRWSNKGLFVNDRSVKLRGGCVHHDNGILGAATYDESEWRRVRILKEAGYVSSLNEGSTPLSQADWRKNNINMLVSGIRSALHRANSRAVFGISPQGNFENNEKLSADTASWCSVKGYADYLCPQLYVSMSHPVFPFRALADRWIAFTKDSSLPLYFGLGLYKAGTDADSGTWLSSSSNIREQIAYLRSKGVDGFILYAYDFLTDDHAHAEVENAMAELKPS